MENKSSKIIRTLSLISKMLLIIGLAGGTIYLLVNFLSPTLSMVEVNGILEKDTSFIIITSSFIFAPCLIFSACLKALANNLSGTAQNKKNKEEVKHG